MHINLRGIIPPIVTPLKSESELDEKGLENLIEYLIAGGVHGLFLLGTTGEATNLSYTLRKAFIEKSCAIVKKRVPVMVGITDTCIEGSLEIAEASKNAGADALVISAPYYLPIAQHEFVSYLEFLVPKLPLPFLLYNMPGCTKFHMSVDTVIKGKELGAIGIKDSSGSQSYLYDLQETFKNDDFAVICGTELFMPDAVIHGGYGSVAGGANMFPHVFVELYEAAVAKDFEKIKRLREIVIQIEKKIYNIGKDGSKYIKTIKCALSAMGICSDYVAQPFQPFGKEECELMKKNIQELRETYPEIQVESSTLKTS